jgi:prepilin-type N-terminal cleavage/methylation domain-containing protein
MLSKIRRRSGGFTLIELMIVIAIIAILAAILVPNFIRARAQGQLTACKSNLKNIGTALEMYSTDWAGKYPSGTSLLTPNYLKAIPECPAASSNTYGAAFSTGAPFNPDSYTDYYYIDCQGGWHEPVSVTGNYPAYNGIQGLIERQP